ncbi:hypothetical protein D9Q98_002463 [Chlorella vulgaris]|uniref:Uncharacterized protein n=1 Tax=Chlorella vulgaris TaxID=3077 RepID=A0A9D4TUP6_CHLVU|nr:hypothetical protein D9Q98_002463 [Chlorella vulgaris]
MEGTHQVSGAAGGAGKRADVRRRLADLAAVERQACVERAEEAFVSADRGNPASMLRPIQLLAQGVGSKELEALVCQWETLSTAQQQQAYGVALMVCAEGTWQAQMWRRQLSQLVAVPSQEERSSPAISVAGTEQAPADTAAELAISELALAVLAAPGPPQLTILGHLEQHDKMRLGSACTSLRQASLAWFLEVTAEVVPGETDVASLAAWLERHQAYLHLSAHQINDSDDEFIQECGMGRQPRGPATLIDRLAGHVWPANSRLSPYGPHPAEGCVRSGH